MFSRTILNKLLNNGPIQNITMFNCDKIVEIGVGIVQIWSLESSGFT